MSKTETITGIQDIIVHAPHKQTHLTGLRGILVVSSFLWVFFKTFIPSIVSASVGGASTQGPAYQTVIRDVLSILWNESLIYNGFILLAMRTIATSFLENPTAQVYAATVIRRIIRMVIILCAASGIATLIYSQIGTTLVQDFIKTLPNSSITAPIKTYNGLSAVNSLFDLFWLTTDFYTQAANSFWPTQTLWTSSIIYYQSWTVYFLMVFLPYTRPKWHLQGLALFALGSFWMESRGWYSATGLFFADLAINPTLNDSFKRGLNIGWRIPYWTIALLATAAGIALKYIFIVFPEHANSMLVLHPYLDLSETYTVNSTVKAGPYARLDDWLVIVGIFIALESFDTLRRALSIKPLLILGYRSFSIFTAQSIIFWTAGIKLWLTLSNAGLDTASANAITFFTCTAAIALCSEIFYRTIDLPSRALAQLTYTWLVN